MTTLNNWYIFNEVKGVIADMDNEKFAGIKPVATNGNFGFYQLSSIEGKDITDNDCALEYYDSYEPTPVNIHEEIVSQQVVNIENSQRLIDCFVNKDLYEEDLYERMMCTVTDDTYDWTSELTRLKDYAQYLRDRNLQNVKEMVENRWNEYCDSYSALNVQFVEKKTFDEVWNIINDNND